MSSRRLIRCAAPVVAACLLLTATPALAAPGPHTPHTLFDRLHDLWTGLWNQVTDPIGRIFAAQGIGIDPDGTSSAQTVAVSGTEVPSAPAVRARVSARTL